MGKKVIEENSLSQIKHKTLVEYDLRTIGWPSYISHFIEPRSFFVSLQDIESNVGQVFQATLTQTANLKV